MTISIKNERFQLGKMPFLRKKFIFWSTKVSFVKFCGHFWSKTPRSRWLSWFSRLNYKVQILIMVERYLKKTFWFYLWKIKYDIDLWKTIFTQKYLFCRKIRMLSKTYQNDYFRDHLKFQKSEIKGGAVKNTTWSGLEFCSRKML